MHGLYFKRGRKLKKIAIVTLALIYSFLSSNMLFAADTTPDQFNFTDRTNVALSTEYKSNAITVSGIDTATLISVTGGTYSVNGAAFTSASGTVNLGNTVKVRKVSAASYSTTENATLTIGGVSDTFSVTTLIDPADTTPDPFHFTDRTNVALSTEYKSNAITVSGIGSATPISIIGGTYAINGAAFTSASGTVSLGNTVKLRKMSSSSYATTKNATLTIGGISDTFSVTTQTSAPVIMTQPLSQTVLAGQKATFTVVATGAATLHYQWKKGNTNVGTDLESYTTPDTTTLDNGATFTVVVNNNAGSVNSNNITLSVNESETFAESNRPGLEYNVTGDFFLVKPWNYEKDYNASRKYPILIYLHGSSQIKYLKNLYYMGMGYYTWSDVVHNMTEEYQKPIADNFRQTYPCFMYVPQGPSGFNIPAIIAQIEKFKTDYRIDSNRIYVHGFSMGGWGSYTLAKSYYDYNGQLFAGIIMLSGGGSLTSSYDNIVKKTAIWLVTGAIDLSSAQSAYNYLKNHTLNAAAVETYSGDYTVTSLGIGYPARTWTLNKNGWDFARMTVFPNADHFTTCFPFGDPDVMAWLFEQSLENR